MPTDSAPKTPRWKRALGYAAFTLFAFVLSLYLTFPYDALAGVVQSAAESAGYQVQFGSMGPGLFGVTARQVRLMHKPPPGEEANPAEGLLLDSVALRPALFPPGVAVSASALGGSVRGSVGRMGSSSVRLTLDGLDPQKGNFRNFTGVDMAARINGRLSLDVPTAEKGNEPDYGAANGLFSLELNGVQVNGGTLKGDMPLDLPKANLGDITAKVKFEKGVGTVETLEGTGEDLKLGGEGTINLARRLETSQLNLTVRLKPSPEFQRSAGLLGSGISFLPPDKKDPTFRAARVTGAVGSPHFQPAR